MKRTRVFLPVVIFLFLPLLAVCEDGSGKPVSEKLAQFPEPRPQETQRQLEATAAKSREAREADLETKVVELKALLMVDERQLFDAALATWSDFRDRQCEFVGALFAGGSIRSLQIADCRRRLAKQLLEELDGVAKSIEGRR